MAKVEFINSVEVIAGESATYITPAISVADTEVLKVYAWNNMDNIVPLLDTPGVIEKELLVDLPTATVTKLDTATITDTDVDFAVNFVADPVTEEQLAEYSDWYADFVLVSNKEVTLNANGGAEGYLAGQYDNWSTAWVVVPFEDVQVTANTPIKIMEYASELMGKPGLKYTYGDVYTSVADFDCGLYITDEFRKANPDLEITLELRMFNPANEEEYFVIGSTYVYKPGPFPENTVTYEAEYAGVYEVTSDIDATVTLANISIHSAGELSGNATWGPS